MTSTVTATLTPPIPPRWRIGDFTCGGTACLPRLGLIDWDRASAGGRRCPDLVLRGHGLRPKGIWGLHSQGISKRGHPPISLLDLSKGLNGPASKSGPQRVNTRQTRPGRGNAEKRGFGGGCARNEAAEKWIFNGSTGSAPEPPSGGPMAFGDSMEAPAYETHES